MIQILKEIINGSIFLLNLWYQENSIHSILSILLKTILCLTMVWSLQYIRKFSHKEAKNLKKYGNVWACKYPTKKALSNVSTQNVITTNFPLNLSQNTQKTSFSSPTHTLTHIANLANISLKNYHKISN